MRVVSVVNQKGGVGKSTLAINIATVAEAKGDRVLLIDLDPQGSSVLWGQTRGTNRPLVAATQPERLPAIISAAAEFGTTLVLIDAPSRLDPIALAAVRAANTIICPTMVDLINLAPLRETVALINSADKLEATIAVINNSDPASKRVESAREELARVPTWAATSRSCAARTPSISRAGSGRRMRLSVTSWRSRSMSRIPRLATMPNSAKCARIALIRLLRWRINRSRVR